VLLLIAVASATLAVALGRVVPLVLVLVLLSLEPPQAASRVTTNNGKRRFRRMAEAPVAGKSLA
jgi:hypothetical protein